MRGSSFRHVDDRRLGERLEPLLTQFGPDAGLLRAGVGDVRSEIEMLVHPDRAGALDQPSVDQQLEIVHDLLLAKGVRDRSVRGWIRNGSKKSLNPIITILDTFLETFQTRVILRSAGSAT